MCLYTSTCREHSVQIWVESYARLNNKLICIKIYMKGWCLCSTSIFCNEIHLAQKLFYIKLNFTVVYYFTIYTLVTLPSQLVTEKLEHFPPLALIKDLSCLLHVFYQKMLTYI